MKQDAQKSIIKTGTLIWLRLPNGETIETKIQLVEGRYLWIHELPEAEQWKRQGNFLTIQLAQDDSSVVFKVVPAEREMIGGVSMTKLIAITQPADNNRREAFRLQKMYDLSVYRKFKKKTEAEALVSQGLDISDTGLGFASPQWFQYGEMIECRFNLDGALFNLSAKVVRVIKQRTETQENIYRVGAIFIRQGDNTKKKIRRYIYNQQTAQRKSMRKEENE